MREFSRTTTAQKLIGRNSRFKRRSRAVIQYIEAGKHTSFELQKEIPMSASGHQIKTMCPMNCNPTYCGMLVEVENDRVITIKGDPENPDSRGFLCMRGHATREIPRNPRRLLSPLRRVGKRGE